MQNGQIIGQYRLIEKIGDGGMGEVWKAEHTRMLRIEALKFLHSSAEVRPEAIERFLKEAQLQSRFQHPNIVGVFGSFEEAPYHCLAMQFIDGETLERRLARQKPQLMHLSEVSRIATDVLAGLEYAHTFPGGGVVHRDIKPSNIMIDQSGRTLITDFGIAFANDSNRLTREGTTLGTVFYMSPEQIQDPRRVGARSDIYSFGCVLYELLAGRPPFGAETDTDYTVKTAHVRDTPTPLGQWNRNIPFEIELIVYKALNKKPEMRYASCAEMSVALQKAIASLGQAPSITPRPSRETRQEFLPPSPRPSDGGQNFAQPGGYGAAGEAPPPIPPPPPPRKKKGLLMWGAIAVVLLLAAIFGGIFYMHSEEIILSLKGSTSVGDELAPKMAEAFLRDQLKATSTGQYVASKDSDGHSYVHVWGDVPNKLHRQVIEIYATGSGDAFKCLAAEAASAAHCDLGMASRPYNADDRKKFPDLGNLNNPANERVIALDGIAVIVNPSNSISHLTMAQLHDIYTGAVTNWRQVGGDDRAIVLYGRDAKSGTGEMFNQMVVGKGNKPVIPTENLKGDSGAIVDTVVHSPEAIGYVSSPLIKSAKPLAISDGSGAALRPSELAVVTEDYPIGRRLFLYESNSASDMAKSFVHYAVNEQGQSVVSDVHYVGLTPKAFSVDAPADAPDAYRQIASSYDKLGLSFRFASGQSNAAANGGDSLDNLARDNVNRLESYLAKNPSAVNRVLLVGYADNRGIPAKNVTLALQRAQSISAALGDDDIHIPAQNIRSFGQEMPIASNAADAGQARNRRVEVWVPK